MEEKTQVEMLLIHMRDFLKENFSLLVLNTYEKISRVISGITSILFLASLLIFILLFVSVGLALWVGTLIQEPYAGFFIVGGFYLLTGIIFYVNREKWIKAPIIDGLLKSMTDEKN